MAATLLPKQRLKDYCRKKQLPSPIYKLISDEKIDLHKHYTIQVCINDVVTTEGRGLSRRIAEFKAAMSAMYLIGQSDPTVFDNNRPPKFGRLSLGRSFSVDHISRAQRTDSMPSMMSLAVGPGQFSSAGPSIDGIDSLTENNDSLYGSEIANGKDDYANRNSTIANNKVDEEEASSESTDEGVELEISESSATPTASFPTSLAAPQVKAIAENENSQKPSNQVQSSSDQKPPAESKGEQTTLKSKEKKSLSSSFLSSFFMISSLRSFSRRSLRRKTPPKQSSLKSAESSSESTTANNATTQSRPTSATSSASTSSAFSSISSISSSQQTSSNSSTSGSFTLPDDSVRADADVPLLNGFSSLMMADTIIEEEEEEEEEEETAKEKTTVDSSQRKVSIESNKSTTLCDGGHLERHSHDMSGSMTLPRSSSSSYVLSSMCPHNHFSIYGPVLCSNQQAAKNLTIEATPSAALLRYCVRLFCPLPYYDIRGSNSKFDTKFYVTCRVVLSTSKTDKDKLPITLPEQYKNYEFTARGNGETLRSARNMAAQTIIDKLKNANIYFE